MELGLESLKSRKWFRRFCSIFKIMKNQTPKYLNNLIPKRKQNFNTKNIYIPSYKCRTEEFFFHASLEKWFHLDRTINAFKQKLLPFLS